MKKQATSLVPLLAALTFAIVPSALLPSPASADWYWQNPLPVGDGLGHVVFVSATEGWTTSSGGRLLHTTDGGATWGSLNPEPGQSLRFKDGPGPGISFVGASNGWVIGTSGTMEEPAGAAIFSTTNGGASWTQTNIPGADYGIGIQFLDANHGWALIGTGTFPTSITGAVIRTTDGGGSWNTAHTTAAQEVVLYISFVSASEGWAVQDSVDASGDFVPPFKILHTTDGGSNWSTQFTASTGGEFEVIQFTDALNGWMCGSDARLMKTTNGGALWSDVTTCVDPGARNDALFFLDANTGWVAGNSGGGGGSSIARTTDGGSTWSCANPGLSYMVSDLWFEDATHGWAVAYGGGVARTTDGGDTWTVLSSNAASNTGRLESVAALDKFGGADLWAVGDFGDILHSGDGGAHWAVQGNAIKPLYGIAFASATQGLLVGDGATIRRTINGGAAWLPPANPVPIPPIPLFEVAYPSTGAAFAVGSSGTILNSSDGGDTWVNQTSTVALDLYSVFFRDASEGWAVGAFGVIVHTTNGGGTWAPQTSPTLASLNDIAFADATHGIAVGDNGTVLTTVDGGTTWDDHSILPLYFLQAVAMTSDLNAVAVGSSGSIYVTADGGTTWNRDVSGTDSWLSDIALVSQGNGLVVGEDQGVLSTSTAVAVEISLVDAETLPGSVKLRWYSPGGAGVVATLYRSEPGQDWAAVSTLRADGTGHLVYQDREVAPNRRYGYRLGVLDGDHETFLGEVWVNVPGELALSGVRPNPTSDAFEVGFSLESGAPASLDAFDLGGRRIEHRDVGSLGPGAHALRLGERTHLAPGVYVVQLTQGKRKLATKACVIR